MTPAALRSLMLLLIGLVTVLNPSIGFRANLSAADPPGRELTWRHLGTSHCR